MSEGGSNPGLLGEGPAA